MRTDELLQVKDRDLLETQLGMRYSLEEITTDHPLHDQNLYLVADAYRVFTRVGDDFLLTPKEVAQELLTDDGYSPNARTYAMVENGSNTIVASVRIVDGDGDNEIHPPLDFMNFFTLDDNSSWPHLNPNLYETGSKDGEHSKVVEFTRFVVNPQYRDDKGRIINDFYDGVTTLLRKGDVSMIYMVMKPSLSALLTRMGLNPIPVFNSHLIKEKAEEMERRYPGYWDDDIGLYTLGAYLDVSGLLADH